MKRTTSKPKLLYASSRHKARFAKRPYLVTVTQCLCGVKALDQSSVAGRPVEGKRMMSSNFQLVESSSADTNQHDPGDLNDLLEELRILLPGVQVLTAF